MGSGLWFIPLMLSLTCAPFPFYINGMTKIQPNKKIYWLDNSDEENERSITAYLNKHDRLYICVKFESDDLTEERYVTLDLDSAIDFVSHLNNVISDFSNE